MSEPPLRVGLMGLGHQGRDQMGHLLAMGGLLTVVTDADVSARRHVPAEVIFAENREAFWAQCDAAVVAVPPHVYADIVEEATRRGKHLLLEKPPGLSLGQALEFRKKASDAGLVLETAVQRRHHPAYAAWKLYRDRVGDPLEVMIRQEITKKPESWRCDARRNGGRGALFDLGFHAVDLALQFCGDLRLVSGVFFDADGNPCHDGQDYYADILLEAEVKSAPVRIRVGRGCAEKHESVVVRGERGVLRLSRERAVLEDAEGRESHEVQKDEAEQLAMRRQLTQWVSKIRAVRAGESPGASETWHAFIAMRLMEEAYAHGSL